MKKEHVLDQIEYAHRAVSKVDKSLIKKFTRKNSSVSFSGIGKSGQVYRVIKNLGLDTPIEMAVSNNLSDLNSRSLGVVVSYSGITKDITDFYKNLQEKTDRIIVISSNIALIKNATKKGYLAVKLPDEFNSANSFFLVLYATLLILRKIKVLKLTEKYVEESITKVSSFSKNFKSYQLSNLLKDKIPLIYAWDDYSSLGYLIASSFNLHAKHYCLRSLIPEADYNEVEALAYGDDKVLPIFLMPPEVRARKVMDKVKAYAKDYEIFDQPKGNKLTQIVYTYMFFELVSKRLSEIKGVDSNSRDVVNGLKKLI